MKERFPRGCCSLLAVSHFSSHRPQFWPSFAISSTCHPTTSCEREQVWLDVELWMND